MDKTWEQIAAENDQRSQRAFVLSGVVLSAGILLAAVAASIVPARSASGTDSTASAPAPMLLTSDQG